MCRCLNQELSFFIEFDVTWFIWEEWKFGLTSVRAPTVIVLRVILGILLSLICGTLVVRWCVEIVVLLIGFSSIEGNALVNIDSSSTDSCSSLDIFFFLDGLNRCSTNN